MNGIENGTTSETDRSCAGSNPAQRTNQQTISGAIKGLFRAAAKAVTNSEDEPKPATRHRSGETEGELRKRMPAADHGSGRPAARGLYVMLQQQDGEQGFRKHMIRLFRKMARQTGEDGRDLPPTFDTDWWHRHQQSTVAGDPEQGQDCRPGRPDCPSPTL